MENYCHPVTCNEGLEKLTLRIIGPCLRRYYYCSKSRAVYCKPLPTSCYFKLPQSQHTQHTSDLALGVFLWNKRTRPFQNSENSSSGRIILIEDISSCFSTHNKSKSPPPPSSKAQQRYMILISYYGNTFRLSLHHLQTNVHMQKVQSVPLQARGTQRVPGS